VKPDFEEQDLSQINPVSIADRKSKLTIDRIVDPAKAFGGVDRQGADALAAGLPDILAARSLKKLVAALREARANEKEMMWLVGAHAIKCGLSLYLNALIDAGFITSLSTTGASVIHDLELAFFGKTSEHVEDELPAGRFGMAVETSRHFNAACHRAAQSGSGLGCGVGDYIAASDAPHKDVSVFRRAHGAGVPATVHVSFGTDIVHQHPTFPAAQVGELTMKDFRIVTKRVGRLFDGGVVVVFGSAVILPEVFLKAVSINYNLGKNPANVTAASFDMVPQYRVKENVLSRPFQEGGESHAITGHHEVMLPLLYFLLTG
jgi:hypothetical protein